MALNDQAYDCQIITSDDEELNFLYYDKFQPQDTLVPLRPVRQDTGSSPWETRTAGGDVFSQGDFSGGMGQSRYHSPTRDESRYLWSEGFDISEEGTLRHLHPLETLTTGYIGPLVIANGILFCVKVGGSAEVGKTSDLSAFADETAYGSGGVVDLVSSGTKLYVSINDSLTGVIRERSSAGSYSTAWGPTSNVVPAKMLWAFDRIIFFGNQRLYEVVPGGTESVIDIFPDGHTVRALWAAGPHIYAADESSNQSSIRHYGLNSDASAIEAKGSTDMPNEVDIWSGTGYVGQVLIAGARADTGNTTAPVLLQAFPSAEGHLQWNVIAEGKNGMTATSPQLRVDSMAVLDNRVIMSWDTGTSDELAGQKQGTAFFDLSTGAFSLGHDITSTVSTVAHYTTKYLGRIVHDKGVNIRKENLSKYEATATIISSVADWNNAGTKLWQTFDIAYMKPLPSTASVSVYYTTKHPEDGDWTLVGTDSTADSLGKRFTPATPINSRTLAIKIVSSATTDGTDAPEIQSFSVRSDPTVSTADIQWQLQRVVRLLPRDSKGTNPNLPQKPHEMRTSLMELAHQPFTFKEGADTWTVQMVAPSGDFKPSLTDGDVTLPESSPKDGYLFQLTMQGVRS